MGRKCCVIFCKVNNDDDRKTKIFRLPSEKRCAEERKTWIKSIPNSIHNSKYTSICEKHWPPGYKTVAMHGKLRPSEPPSIFSHLPKSVIPTAPSKPRLTSRCRFENRTAVADQYAQFKKKDNLTFEVLSKEAATQEFTCPIVSYKIGDTLYLQSCSYFKDAVPSFLIKVTEDLKYDAYQAGIRCTIQSLSTNRINILNSWSKVEEAVRFLKNRPVTHKMLVMKEQLDVMGAQKCVEKSYSSDTIVRAFRYYATLKSCYEKFRTDYKLPSVRTLRKLTSKVSKLNDKEFVSNIFPNLDEKQGKCIVLVDEVYVKPSLQYHGGHIFGKAANNPDALANTVLAIMIKCLNGGPRFLVKMIPVSKLNATFLYDQVCQILEIIKSSSGTVMAVITDNNRTNQAFFKLFNTPESKPWKTSDGIFLLYDYVHLLKSVRNNWVTEKTQNLEFEHENKKEIAS